MANWRSIASVFVFAARPNHVKISTNQSPGILDNSPTIKQCGSTVKIAKLRCIPASSTKHFTSSTQLFNAACEEVHVRMRDALVENFNQ